jgi:phage repressor protein C with HTH and peptisase S24 domain
MLTHKQIWRGLDNLAVKTEMSVSALAKAAGLDATTFNRSKRFTTDGNRPRWPSTESIAKVLDALQVDFEEFAILSGSNNSRVETGRAVPMLGFAQAGAGGFFDDGGFPVGTGWDEVRFPGLAADNCYALEISGDSMLPVFRDGDRIVVAPEESLRRGDRVVVRTIDGEVMAKELRSISNKKIELASLNPEYPGRKLDRSQVDWIARIVWASQ